MAASETMGANFAGGVEQTEGMQEMPGIPDAIAVLNNLKPLLIIGIIITVIGAFCLIPLRIFKK